MLRLHSKYHWSPRVIPNPAIYSMASSQVNKSAIQLSPYISMDIPSTERNAEVSKRTRTDAITKDRCTYMDWSTLLCSKIITVSELEDNNT